MSDNTTGLEAETRHETTTFDHFGHTWSVPTKRHLSHIKKMRDEIRAGVSSYDLLVAETMLTEDQFLKLIGIDPSEDRLDEFVGEIAKAMGLNNSGNSAPSSTSS